MTINETHHVNALFNSVSYRIGDVLTDPGDEWKGFYNVKIILLTHAHFDHIYGLNRCAELNPGVRIITNEFGKNMLSDPRKNMSYYNETPFECNYMQNVEAVTNGERISDQCDLSIFPVFTPGHNPSCITWIVNNYLLTGDSYIPGIPVVTNLPGGNKSEAKQSVNEILQLAKGRIILPGHKIE